MKKRPNRVKPAVPHVALLIETSRTYGRGLLRGVKRYIAEHGPWSVFLESRGLNSQAPGWLKDWSGAGILTRSGSQAMINVVESTGVPVVELRATKLRHRFPFVGVDNTVVGRIVAEHFLERGFRNFGVFELDTEEYFEERRDHFIRAIVAKGCTCTVFRTQRGRESPARWEKQQDALADWVLGLPKPVGVMASTDQLGFWLLDACRRAALAVPEEIAIVGVENDESLCSMSTPPLSSVAFNAQRIGYEAAVLLDRMMSGRKPPDKPTFIPPLGIVERKSSDALAMEDRDVANAIRFIRENACKGITAADVVNVVPMSRSALERRMRQAIGRTPKAEINRVQLQRVKQLLVESDLTLSAIAVRAGFEHPQHMAAIFKQKFGSPPGAYRIAARP